MEVRETGAEFPGAGTEFPRAGGAFSHAGSDLLGAHAEFRRAPAESPGAGTELLRAGERSLRAGEELPRAGEELLHAGEELPRARDKILHAVEEFLRAGEEFRNTGEDGRAPAVRLRVTTTASPRSTYARPDAAQGLARAPSDFPDHVTASASRGERFARRRCLVQQRAQRAAYHRTTVPPYYRHCGQRNTLAGTVRSLVAAMSLGSARKNVVLFVFEKRSSK